MVARSRSWQLDWLSFITSVIESVAWPIAAIVLALVLRKPLAGVLGIVRKLKYKGVELEFQRRLDEVADEAESQLVALQPLALPSRFGEAIRIAAISPRSAVLEAWRELERSATQAAERLQLQLPQVRSPFHVIRILRDRGLIDDNKQDILNTLRDLRNQAAHTDLDLNTDTALRYVSLSSDMSTFLDGLS